MNNKEYMERYDEMPPRDEPEGEYRCSECGTKELPQHCKAQTEMGYVDIPEHYECSQCGKWVDENDFSQRGGVIMSGIAVLIRPEMYQVAWFCPDCSYRDEVSYTDLAKRGNPVCPRCDADMKMSDSRKYFSIEER